MPGSPYSGPWPELTPLQQELAERLRSHVYRLAHQIGPRNAQFYPALTQSADYIQSCLEGFGYQVRRHAYQVGGQIFENLETLQDGPFTVVGAHYDSVLDCPGANDNASGVAGVLELARMLQGCQHLRFVLFPNEEPPFYKTPDMGSQQYLQFLMQSSQPISSMICLETVGYYSQAPGSQRSVYPDMLPEVGNFVALVGDVQSAQLVKGLVAEWYRGEIPFPCLGLVPQPEAEPALLAAGMDMSDHACFWDQGIPALMVTDTVFYRYDHYHLLSDTWDQLTYAPFAQMLDGLAQVLARPDGWQRAKARPG